MSKEGIEKYLRDNVSKFSISDLKQKLIDGGYSKEDVDKAGAKISGGKEVVPVISKEGGFRWLWWTGMFVFIFLGIGVFNFAMGFLAGSISQAVSIIISIILLVVVLTGFVIVFEGWLKLAKHTNSKLMRFGVLGILYTIMAIFVMALIMIVISLVSLSLSLMSGLLWFVFLGVYFLAIIFLFVCAVLIYVALIKIKGQVRFARLVGVLGLISMGVGIIVSIYQLLFFQSIISSMMNSVPSAGGGLVAGGSSSTAWVFLVISIIMGIIGLVVGVLMGLMFFDASKKFEE